MFSTSAKTIRTPSNDLFDVHSSIEYEKIHVSSANVRYALCILGRNAGTWSQRPALRESMSRRMQIAIVAAGHTVCAAAPHRVCAGCARAGCWTAFHRPSYCRLLKEAVGRCSGHGDVRDYPVGSNGNNCDFKARDTQSITRSNHCACLLLSTPRWKYGFDFLPHL
jgi:hypothetical protein